MEKEKIISNLKKAIKDAEKDALCMIMTGTCESNSFLITAGAHKLGITLLYRDILEGMDYIKEKERIARIFEEEESNNRNEVV